MTKSIKYEVNVTPETDLIIDLYLSAGLNRPVEDKERISKMFANSNLIITAWHDELLIGVSRAVTDFSFCCYLSDLAVRQSYQKMGIGRKLIEITKMESGDEAMLLLLSVPTALSYYPKVGLRKVENGFIVDRKI